MEETSQFEWNWCTATLFTVFLIILVGLIVGGTCAAAFYLKNSRRRQNRYRPTYRGDQNDYYYNDYNQHHLYPSEFLNFFTSQDVIMGSLPHQRGRSTRNYAEMVSSELKPQYDKAVPLGMGVMGASYYGMTLAQEYVVAMYWQKMYEKYVRKMARERGIKESQNDSVNKKQDGGGDSLQDDRDLLKKSFG